MKRDKRVAICHKCMRSNRPLQRVGRKMLCGPCAGKTVNQAHEGYRLGDRAKLGA